MQMKSWQFWTTANIIKVVTFILTAERNGPPPTRRTLAMSFGKKYIHTRRMIYLFESDILRETGAWNKFGKVLTLGAVGKGYTNQISPTMRRILGIGND